MDHTKASVYALESTEFSDCWSPQGWLQEFKPSRARSQSQQLSSGQTRKHPTLVTTGTRQTGRKPSVKTQPATADNKPSEQLQQAVPQSATGDKDIKSSTSSERHKNGHVHAVASMQSFQAVGQPASGANKRQFASTACQDILDPCQQQAAAAPEAADPAVMLAAQLIQQPVLLQGVLVHLEHFAAQGIDPTVLTGPARPAGCSDVHVSMPAMSAQPEADAAAQSTVSDSQGAGGKQAVELLAPCDSSPAAAADLQQVMGTSQGPADMLNQQCCVSFAPHTIRQQACTATLMLPGDDPQADTAAAAGVVAGMQQWGPTFWGSVALAGNTPLMLACREGHGRLVKLFVRKGADVAAHNLEGMTAEQLALSKGHTGIVKFLHESKNASQSES
ncbi:MAG: hypothetical protein FRX49_07091 [Trebouxia sp. A1-2]|nr:MAG: hypothetical protein FRX49_07091 [Trebouxia sp. A1-2]